ncbi:MAG: hypothetical protein KJS98_16150 [Nitrospirae bacterium]|nr:hypothetical protein [Nitrospirota bacterium]MDE3041908.1 hypothetical protein [Nitrospirota bacterium]
MASRFRITVIAYPTDVGDRAGFVSFPVLKSWQPARQLILSVRRQTRIRWLIHPFRYGNGRLSRVLSTRMALQAGLPLLDFSVMAGTGKTAYIAAIQAGLDRHYVPMERLFGEVIEQSGSSS